ncbi:MAG: urate hydroxylase PuuD, partial [Verrucomicrobia bacterium]|nr:urate hydroxylase PuuD [Verrucomicrobiota bacterium]
MSAYDIKYWIMFIARWVHVFAAILWIGQTYLFHRMEKCLEPDPDKRADILGRLWMVHGGGLFFVEKQRYPKTLPESLMWFKWESLTTWISGVVLIAMTYYMGGLLVDPEQLAGVDEWGDAVAASGPSPEHLAAAVGIGVIILGWVIYDALALWLAKRRVAMSGAVLVLVMGAAWALQQCHSGRSVYVHIGALLGTIMAANVWMRILPAMRKIIAMTARGEQPSDKLLAVGGVRSNHNSFLVG